MISITLPSIYPEALEVALANIRATTRGPHEVIVVAPIGIAGTVAHEGHITWVDERDSRGCAYGHAAAAHHATGDFLVPFADDHEFVPGWDQVAVQEYVAREEELRASGTVPCQPFALGLRGAHSGHVGTNFGMYYPYFPMMRRKDVQAIGWIGHEYERGFGDSDLAMRVWGAGGRCEWSQAGLLRPSDADSRKKGGDPLHRPAAAYTDNDLRHFVSKWAPRYGHGWGTAIDQFNVDLRPEDNQHLANGNTFTHNSPSFLTQAVRMG